jgi:hypothetical protein
LPGVFLETGSAIDLFDGGADPVLQFAQEGFGAIGLLAHHAFHRFDAASLARSPAPIAVAIRRACARRICTAFN